MHIVHNTQSFEKKFHTPPAAEGATLGHRPDPNAPAPPLFGAGVPDALTQPCSLRP
jgi:hypothetical protein